MLVGLEIRDVYIDVGVVTQNMLVHPDLDTIHVIIIVRGATQSPKVLILDFLAEELRPAAVVHQVDGGVYSWCVEHIVMEDVPGYYLAGISLNIAWGALRYEAPFTVGDLNLELVWIHSSQ